jgi:hypothetical protein
MMFKRELLDLVISGKKTQTRRLHKRVLKVGRIYALKRSWIEFTGDYIKIIRVTRQKLSEVNEDEAGKEGFGSIEEFQKAWIRINGSWNPEMEVIVYDFELTDPPPKQSRLNGQHNSNKADTG